MVDLLLLLVWAGLAFAVWYTPGAWETVPAIIVGLFLLYLIALQLFGFVRVDDSSLTALQSWATGTKKKDLGKILSPVFRTVQFGNIAAVSLRIVAYGNQNMRILVIVMDDGSQGVLKLGAYRDPDCQELIKWLQDKGVKASIEPGAIDE